MCDLNYQKEEREAKTLTDVNPAFKKSITIISSKFSCDNNKNDTIIAKLWNHSVSVSNLFESARQLES
jgi:hypothetical protein